MADAGGDADWGRTSVGRGDRSQHFLDDKRTRRWATLGAALVIGIILLVMIASAMG